MSKQSEAKKELERMFGPEEEQGITAGDKLRVKLVQSQYTRSNIMYRMFFDKHYRPDRYNCIINQQEKFKNKNEFRTYVMQNYYRFPVKSTAFLKIGGSQIDVAQQPETSENDNILLERRLLRSYNRAYLGELTLYSVVCGTLLYFGTAAVTGTFSLKVANYCFIVPGIALSAGNFYARTQHNRAFEVQLRDIYKADIAKYERFFRDQGYDEYE